MANNPIIGRWRKQPREELRYEVDWSKWLLPEEYLVSAGVLIVENSVYDPDIPLTEQLWVPLEVSPAYFLIDSKGCVFFVRGGKDQTQYQVTHWVTTSGGQRAEREILYDVEEV